MRPIRSILMIVCAAGLASERAPRLAHAADPAPTPQVEFRRDIWPVIQTKCLDCHNAKKRQGSLDMSSRTAMLKGGDSGAAFVPGNVEKSLMIELIEFGEMPPRKQKQGRVTPAELKKLRAWIAQGAVAPDEPEQSQR